MQGIANFVFKLALLAAAIGVDASPLARKSALPGADRPHYFRMPIDHFNASDHRTFNNRYYVNATYYRAGGPVFLYDNGEQYFDPTSAAAMLAEVDGETGIMQLAKRHRGLAIGWEHRYFGNSLPFPLAFQNGSVTDPYTCSQAGDYCTHEPVNAPESYKYLTIDQALEDVVYFAHNFRPSGIDYPLTPEHTPWIWVGGSYPGARAAFIRQRNPETFFASWASSAPVESRLDGSAYFNTIERSLPEPCKSDWIAAINYADDIMDGKHGKEAFENLRKLVFVVSATVQGLNSTYNISGAATLSRADIANILQDSFGQGNNAFQYTGPNGTTNIVCQFMEHYAPFAPASNRTTREETILSNPGTGKLHKEGLSKVYSPAIALEAYIYAMRRFLYQDYLSSASSGSGGGGSGGGTKVEVDETADNNAWNWIVDTAFGDFQGSNPANISLVSRYSNWTSAREEQDAEFTFSPKVFRGKPDVSQVDKYGGWKMNPSHVMFTNGQFDPWRGFSVASQDTNYGSPERKIVQDVPRCKTAPKEGTAFGLVYPGQVHCSDLDSQQGGMDDKSSPLYLAVSLFSSALDAWLPCFNKE